MASACNRAKVRDGLDVGPRTLCDAPVDAPEVRRVALECPFRPIERQPVGPIRKIVAAVLTHGGLHQHEACPQRRRPGARHVHNVIEVRVPHTVVPLDVGARQPGAPRAVRARPRAELAAASGRLRERQGRAGVVAAALPREICAAGDAALPRGVAERPPRRAVAAAARRVRVVADHAAHGGDVLGIGGEDVEALWVPSDRGALERLARPPLERAVRRLSLVDSHGFGGLLLTARSRALPGRIIAGLSLSCWAFPHLPVLRRKAAARLAIPQRGRYPVCVQRAEAHAAGRVGPKVSPRLLQQRVDHQLREARSARRRLRVVRRVGRLAVGEVALRVRPALGQLVLLGSVQARVGPHHRAELVLDEDKVAVAGAQRVARLDHQSDLRVELAEDEPREHAEQRRALGGGANVEPVPTARPRHGDRRAISDQLAHLDGRERLEDELVDRDDELERDRVEQQVGDGL
eukprot:4984341-Prymnesium_polylepis.2